MGVSVGGESGGKGKGRRRGLDADINLVPFIDLLSMCICFLLMTAVWIELGSVQVKQQMGTDVSEESKKAPLDYELKFASVNQIDVVVKKNGSVAKTLSVQGATTEDRMTQIKQLIGALPGQLGLIQGVAERGQMPSLVSSAKVTPNIGVPYGELVSLMDALRSEGVLNLGVVPLPVRN